MDDKEKKDFKGVLSPDEREQKELPHPKEHVEETDHLSETKDEFVMRWGEGLFDRMLSSRRVDSQNVRRKRGLTGVVEVCVYAIVLALLVRVFCVESFHVPTSSMSPAILDHDSILVTKWSYGSYLPFLKNVFPVQTPNRGDIVVFRHPKSGEFHIKRVVGVPGDRIAMKGGRLIVNGNDIALSYYSNQPHSHEGLMLAREQLTETVSYDVLVSGTDQVDPTEEVKISENEYFVLGDRRVSSEDSRHFGPIQQASLVGRARWVWWSYETDPSFHIRWSHIGAIK